MFRLLLVLLLAPIITFSQSRKQKKALELQKKADVQLLERLKTHVDFLASDSLEGRSAGSRGEQAAMMYITNQFAAIGLQAKGSNGYVQPFTINTRKTIAPSTSLVVDGNELQLSTHYTPLAFSARSAVSGMPAMALREAGVPWFVDAANILNGFSANPHFDLATALKKEAAKVAAKGGTAMFVYSSNPAHHIEFDRSYFGDTAAIPAVWLTPAALKTYFSDPSALLDIELNVGWDTTRRMGYNVVGYVDNGAPRTVVVGAHYDHLGWGDDHNALDTGHLIHNGADDNASGTAALIELARLVQSGSNRNNNYLFIAFSGEEQGLFGSKYWLANPTVSTTCNYMINLDMVGRYEPSRKLMIGGYGTSPVWGNLLPSISTNLAITYDSTGSGPSDHASFYRKNIPVLFFFTGSHPDYHKASDDADKINFDGLTNIVRYIYQVLQQADGRGPLAFLPTAEPPAPRFARFTVTLGIIPDYTFTAGGLRIDGVAPNKIAAKMGLQPGDIITRLGRYEIKEINSYMEALSGFKVGDTATIMIKRGKESKEFRVDF